MSGLPSPLLSNSAIIAAYRDKTPLSASLAALARNMFPSGVTHDSRHLDPYGIYVERALGLLRRVFLAPSVHQPVKTGVKADGIRSLRLVHCAAQDGGQGSLHKLRLAMLRREGGI